MLATITLLTAYIFSVVYPLCFWVSYQDPLKNRFHAFHLGLPNITTGMVVFYIATHDFPQELKIVSSIWLSLLVLISGLMWKREYPDVKIISIPCIVGLYGYTLLHSHLISSNILGIIIAILAGLIFSAALFAMNLGHWYLNVHGLPIIHLSRSVKILGIFLILRLILNGFIFCTETILYDGDTISLFSFLGTMEGIFIWIAIFFGTLFPLIGLWFVNETIRLKNTQSATGILFVLLSAVLLGDIAYKYYWIRYNLPI